MHPHHTLTGNPFVGLNAFTEQQGQQFKGRDVIISLALERLSKKAQNQRPFLLLLGNHGAGKSSLISAGILANLHHCALFPDIQQFHSVQLHPCDIGNDPIRALVAALMELVDYPLLEGQLLASAVETCIHQPSVFIEHIRQRKAQLPGNETAVIAIHQLERLFISDSIGDHEKQVFVELIVGLCNQCEFFILASLRSDFYNQLSHYPDLLWLKQNGGQLDVLPPKIEQIRQMVAPLSLKFEEGKEGQPPLDEFIAQRTDALPNSLPVMQFILKYLYEHQSQNGVINFAAYRKLGGLEQAIAKVTEQAYESLPRSSKRYFSKVINRLVVKSIHGRYERLWVERDQLITGNGAQQLVETFIDVGVFTQHTGFDGQVYIALSHDCLFEHWPRLVEKLDKYHKVQLLKLMIEAQAKEWKSSTRPSAFLLSSGKALDEGKLILKQGGPIHSQVRAFIQASIRRATFHRRMWISGCVLLLLVFGLILSNSYNAKIAKKQAQNDLVKSHQLIEFLIDDGSIKLEEIGRLDLMQAGSRRSFDYFSTVDDIDNSTAAKLSRSRTFFQIGQVFLQNKDYSSAIDAFEKGLYLNNELVTIHPNGFDYHLNLAHANYWIGMTHLLNQDVGKAEQYFLYYQKTAYTLVELQPDNANAKMELSRAFYHIAEIAAQRGQVESATQSFYEAVKFSEKGKIAADQQQLLNTAYSYSWLANKYQSELKIAEVQEMVKGEERIRALLLKRFDDDGNQLRAAVTQWDLAQTHLLLGQNKQAQNVLSQLLIKSTAMIDSAEANTQWRIVTAFSHSGLAYAAVQEGNLDTASSLFDKSYAILNDIPTINLPKWLDAFYERQYWYARMQLQKRNTSAFNAALIPLNNATNGAADKWKKRVANLQQQPVNLAFEEADLISHPQTLIADLEYASLHNKLERLQSLWQQVPQEMWSNTDLANLRPTLRQQIQQLNAQ